MQRLSARKINQALKNSIKDGAAASVTDGLTGVYTTPYALALGAGNTEIGFLSSIPKLFTMIFQPFVGNYIESKSRKNITRNLALLYRIVWIPILLIPFIFLKEKIFLLIILLTISQVAASISSTAWTCWMGDIVPEKIRGRYFGKRNMIISSVSFFTTLIGGWILGLTNNITGFSIIFFLAVLSGMVSIYYLGKIPDVIYKKPSHKGHKISLHSYDFIKNFRRYRNFSTFTIHMALLGFAVNVASPFFVVYMLQNMNIGYEWFAVITAIEILIAILSQRYWGKLSDRIGDRIVMTVCNILIIFYPFFWLFAKNQYHLMLIGAFSGFAWSGFDLSSFNYLLDVTPPQKRPIYISNYKMIHGISLFSGPLIGGFLAQAFSNVTFLWFSGLQILFLLSFILRGVFSSYTLPRMKEARIKAREVLPIRHIFLKVVAIYPARGIIHELQHIDYCLECWEKEVREKLKGKIHEIF